MPFVIQSPLYNIGGYDISIKHYVGSNTTMHPQYYPNTFSVDFLVYMVCIHML